METYLDRLKKFDVEWEVTNCVRPRLSSQGSELRSASSEAETRKRKLDNTFNMPIEIDTSDLMDHSIEVDFSSEQSDSDSSNNSNQSIESSFDEPPKKKRRLSGDLQTEFHKPDLPSEPKEVHKPMLTTTVTTPTAIITISSPSVGSTPVVIQNEQKPEQIEAEELLQHQTTADEEQEYAPEGSDDQEDGEETTNKGDNKPKCSTSPLKATVKVAAWIAWSGLFFALGRMADPNTIASLLH